MMKETEINELATEIAKCYTSSKTMCDTDQFVKLFLDMRDLAKRMIVEREMKKQNSFDDFDDCRLNSEGSHSRSL